MFLVFCRNWNNCSENIDFSPFKLAIKSNVAELPFNVDG
jgi:hypothetical protein